MTPPPTVALAVGWVESARRALRGRAHDSDWVLWRAACAGDASAATALVAQLTPQALGLAMQLLRRAEDAEDVVQEAFLRLWSSRPSDARGAKLATYFNTIVINRCKTWLTQRRELSLEPEALTALADADEHGGHDGNPARALEAAVEGAAVREAMQRLPARQRMALALWAYADASPADIGQALAIDANAAHQLLHRARRALRTALTPPTEVPHDAR